MSTVLEQLEAKRQELLSTEAKFKKKLSEEKDTAYLEALMKLARGWSRDWIIEAIGDELENRRERV
jgi:hypothetical protein